jgi:anthranilate phosphoribosyltransferase
MKETLEKLYSHATLSKEEAKGLFLKILEDGASQAQVASILTLYRTRTPTLDELEGFREGALQNSVKLDFSRMETIDVCGTGGDEKNTFNISTLSAIVIAACGIKVAKHGGGAVSSRVGSSNLLEALGYKFTSDNDSLQKQLEKAGLCFLHAPLFLPSFKNVAAVRKEMGVKTIFNILGPILNPAEPRYQIIGVYSLELIKLYTYLGQRINKNYTIVHSLDGCDEVSLTSDVKVSISSSEKIYSPSDFGMNKITYEDIREGDDIEGSVRIFNDVLDNKATKAQIDVVAANSGLALFYVNRQKGQRTPLLECVETAKEVISSGKARKIFKEVLEIAAKS